MGIAVLPGVRGGRTVNATPWPLHSPKKDPVPVLQKDVWDRVPVRRARKFLSPTGFDPLKVQPVVSRYRLRYPGPLTKMCLIYYTFSEIGKKYGTIYMKAIVLSLFTSW